MTRASVLRALWTVGTLQSWRKGELLTGQLSYLAKPPTLQCKDGKDIQLLQVSTSSSRCQSTNKGLFLPHPQGIPVQSKTGTGDETDFPLALPLEVPKWSP